MRLLTDLYLKLPISIVTNPKEGLVNVIKNRWWIVTKDDEILMYKGHHPQYNSNGEIGEKLMIEGCSLRFIEVVYLNIKCSEYDYDYN